MLTPAVRDSGEGILDIPHQGKLPLCEPQSDMLYRREMVRKFSINVTQAIQGDWPGLLIARLFILV
ncbi:MAG: hypothetical protein OQL16_01905, partial [Gammaproteobacteria bacterium]|nr:hypothetical protein [Gammaproteobacteria bacterium]